MLLKLLLQSNLSKYSGIMDTSRAMEVLQCWFNLLKIENSWNRYIKSIQTTPYRLKKIFWKCYLKFKVCRNTILMFWHPIFYLFPCKKKLLMSSLITYLLLISTWITIETIMKMYYFSTCKSSNFTSSNNNVNCAEITTRTTWNFKKNFEFPAIWSPEFNRFQNLRRKFNCETHKDFMNFWISRST